MTNICKLLWTKFLSTKNTYLSLTMLWVRLQMNYYTENLKFYVTFKIASRNACSQSGCTLPTPVTDHYVTMVTEINTASVATQVAIHSYI